LLRAHGEERKREEPDEEEKPTAFHHDVVIAGRAQWSYPSSQPRMGRMGMGLRTVDPPEGGC
jgi:hypothetical protein